MDLYVLPAASLPTTKVYGPALGVVGVLSAALALAKKAEMDIEERIRSITVERMVTNVRPKEWVSGW